MNTVLWVIWSSMLVLCSTVAYSAGRHMFPSPQALANARLDGEEDLLDRQAQQRIEDIRRLPRDPAHPPQVWDDTSDHLGELAARYYPPPDEHAGTLALDLRFPVEIVSAQDLPTPDHLDPTAPRPGVGVNPPDPWQEITEAATDIWDAIPDDELFRMHREELAIIRKSLSEPYQLTPWKDQA